MAQRVGPVTIDDNNNEDDDLTVIQVPSEAVGFVTGSQGNFLRQVEEEWGTLMFFADFRGRGERHEVTRRAERIRREQRRRRGGTSCASAPAKARRDESRRQRSATLAALLAASGA